MPVVVLPDGNRLTLADGATAMDAARAIGPGLAKAAIGARINDKVVDLFEPLPEESQLSIITGRDADSLPIIRHSTAHVMAEALCRLYPETKLVYGPAVENGFYYDVDLPHRLTPDDFAAIEAEMQKIVDENRPFTRYEMPRGEAMKKLAAEGNPYKIDNAERASGDVLSFYVTGSEPGKYWEDLCMGTHVPTTGSIGAFKITTVAGAFWHGDATKQQLQRIYGTAFANKKELKAHLDQLEEARKRDHRRIGTELNLYAIDPLVGSGMVLWKPKGAMVRMLLEQHLRDELIRAGYDVVYTPHIGRLELYRTSGHFPYYRDAQFPPLYESETARVLNDLWVAIYEANEVNPGSTFDDAVRDQIARLKQVDSATHDKLLGVGQDSDAKRLIDESGKTEQNLALIREFLQVSDGFLLKPMNCPHHIRIYASEQRSYRDLPVRLAEFGTVYRYEQSGELSGMTRVRGFTQDDAHIFCTPEQIQGEIASCLALTRFVLGAFNMNDFRVRIGLHEPGNSKFIHNPEGWERSEQALIQAAKDAGLDATQEAGEAAFYGPKIDFVVKDCIGREWQLGTVQVDYNAPKRFGLEYIGADNARHQPVMVHRAPLGSMERFIAILIEHFMGAFPLWLSPVQVMVATISEKSEAFAREISALLKSHGLRVEIDLSAEKIGPKKHRARAEKIPYILVIGEQEAAARTVNVNSRDDNSSANMPLDAFVDKLLVENKPPRYNA